MEVFDCRPAGAAFAEQLHLLRQTSGLEICECDGADPFAAAEKNSAPPRQGGHTLPARRLALPLGLRGALVRGAGLRVAKEVSAVENREVVFV